MSLQRRALLAAPVLGLLTLQQAQQAAVAADATTALSTYVDPRDRFSVQVPAGWATGEGELDGNDSFQGASGGRRTVVWFPDDPSLSPRDTNVSLVVTNVSVEFTKLGSFGNVYSFGANLVNSQDRGYLARAPAYLRGKEPVQFAKLLDAREERGMYVVEYTIEKPPEPQRHLTSVLALGYNGRYNRLYTLTAQCLEKDAPRFKAELEAMVRSFKAPPQLTMPGATA